MLQRILKFNLISAAIIAALGFASAAHAAGAAFTLHATQKDYGIDAQTLTVWQIPSGKTTYISFEPEHDPNRYMLIRLGLKKENASKVNYANYNVSAIYDYLKSIQDEIDQPAEDAAFKMQDGKVTDFNPGQDGNNLNIKDSIDQIVEAMSSGQTETQLAISKVTPRVSLADTNSMGIRELVAVGESNFAGSPKNRIFNIKVGVGKETGVIVAPGATFSFNDNLGPVDGEHGFLPELVIKKEGTIPEFGGGLCQVSSTMFRAAMNGGFPITARRNHSYAVSYYAPQGTDATIYPGVQDLKFINDSPAHILIWPKIDKNILRFYIYGTKDQRQTVIDKPNVYDRKPDGSMKATWHRKVTMPDGTVKDDVFKSVYQSPALFHKTEEFAPAAPATTPPSPGPAPNPT